MANTYLSKLGKTFYTFNGSSNSVLITDIMKHCSIDKIVKEEGTAYHEYTMRDEDSPESIANDIYGDSNYNWVFFLVNGIINPVAELPLNQESFEKFLLKKYPGVAIFVREETGNFGQTEELELYNYTSSSSSSNGDVISSLEWNPNFSRIVTSSSDFPDIDDEIVGKTTGTTAIIKRVMVNYESLHFFTRDGTPEGEVVSPLWVIDETPLEDAPDKYTGVDVDISEDDTSMINSYILNIGEFANYAVTHRDYEVSVNELKRKKKILKPEYLPGLAKQLSLILGS